MCLLTTFFPCVAETITTRQYGLEVLGNLLVFAFCLFPVMSGVAKGILQVVIKNSNKMYNLDRMFAVVQKLTLLP